MARNMLTLKSKEALNFHIRSEQYHGFEHPEYFDFDEVLKYVETAIGDKSYKDCLAGMEEKTGIINNVYNKLCKQLNFGINQFGL